MHDVVVIGAGPGGSSTAHFLARAGLDVLLVDRADFPRDKTCGDGLTPCALENLHELGLLPELTSRAWPIRTVEVVAPRRQRLTTPLTAQDHVAAYPPGLVVPREILDNLILERAVAAGATFQPGVRVTDLEPSETGIVVSGEQAGGAVSVEGRLAVVATGANLALPRRLGLLPRRQTMMLAARTYVEGLSGMRECMHFRFHDVPLPGYGWVFPISADAANVGVGVFPAWSPLAAKQPTARNALDAFMRAPAVKELLGDVQVDGQVKGAPLRLDFARSGTVGPRTLLVGEAAGLVNPLTGEGVDYALESGRIAARHLIALFEAGDLSAARLGGYDRLLRRRFQRLFVFSEWVRRVAVNRAGLNFMVALGARFPRLTAGLMSVELSQPQLSARARQQSSLDSGHIG